MSVPIHTATRILQKATAYDNRNPDPATIAAWAEALDPDITLPDALTAVTAHYASTRDWLMPSDINHHCQQLRTQRITADKDTGPALPEGLQDQPQVEAAWRRHYTHAIGRGANRPTAIDYAWRSIHRTPPPQLTAEPHTVDTHQIGA